MNPLCLQVVPPHETAQAIFSYVSKIMMTLKIMKKVINSSSMTMGSSIMQSEAEIKSLLDREKPVDLPALIEGLVELELKNQVQKRIQPPTSSFSPLLSIV